MRLIGEDETKFVCKDCYISLRSRYPVKGQSLKHLLPADVVFSAEYDPSAAATPEESATVAEDTGYIGELVPDGNGGWREPTAAELQAMSAESAAPVGATASEPVEMFSEITVKYRFTTDNKLQVILPKRCRIDERTYELIVKTE